MGELNTLQALFPGPRRLVLSALFGEPDRWWSLPDLAGRAGLQVASLRTHLARLRESGLIRECQNGGQPLFQPDPGCPVFSELQAIVTKLGGNAEGGETVLIVEDQPATAKITRILLESWGYRVFEANSGMEALAIFEKHGGIQLLLTDVIMPGMSGPQLAAALLKLWPGLRVVYMSGYPSDHLNLPGVAFLSKPFNPASLSRMVRRELDRPESLRHMKSR